MLLFCTVEGGGPEVSFTADCRVRFAYQHDRRGGVLAGRVRGGREWGSPRGEERGAGQTQGLG